MALKMTWSVKPESHIQLAKVIKHLLATELATVNLDGIQRNIYDGYAAADTILPETQEFNSGGLKGNTTHSYCLLVANQNPVEIFSV